ncbi:MAG TPA: phospholipid carrier-dependent glycosyltransferase [Solirubrobacteraceae bacterium]|nr:phospholipid carrier-dependent glycosyltransferase [Solirubrobacteraceae bacterium]
MAATPERRPAQRRRRTWLAVAAVLLLAATLVIRLAYVGGTPDRPLVHDALDYDGHAVSIAQGEGYSDELAHGRPTAFRPPGYPYVLGAVYNLAGVEHEPEHERVHVARRAQAVIGTLLVAIAGLLAAQLWGPLVALAATALGAVYVPLVTMSGTVMSEPLFTVFMLASLCAVIQHRRSPHRLRWALVAGLLAGASILTRANAVILLAPLAFAAWDVRPRWSARALAAPVALVVVAALTLVPWTVRNHRTLHTFVPVSTQLGSALGGTYNDEARTDPEHPASWRSLKGVPSYRDLYNTVGRTNEAVLERRIRHRAVRYALDHPLYVPQVVFWTTVRALELDGIDWARHTASTVSIGARWADRGVYCFWAFALLALAGAFTPLARRAPWFVWAFPVLMYLSVAFLVIETPRYRTPVDPFVVLLAALALVTAGRRLARR